MNKTDDIWDAVVIGGGAAGFFAALRIKEINPTKSVLLLEKTQKLLSKVRISGGGRCNVTHYCIQNSALLKHYPRGKKIIKQAVNEFSVSHAIDWFHQHGVPLKVEEDGRMFPASNSSETIAGLFESLAHRFQIKVLRGCQANAIVKNIGESEWSVQTNGHIHSTRTVIIATGGNVSWSHYAWMSDLPIDIISPYPSLFTFKIDQKRLQSLAGVSVVNGVVKLIGYDKYFQGPVLITHWGLSGPAVLKASAWAADWIFEKNYTFQILVSWVLEEENKFRQAFNELIASHSKRKMTNIPIDIPTRLWQYILEEASLSGDCIAGDLSKQQKNKLVELITKMPFDVHGKTTFKEEFVTAGGISEESINPNTMELKNAKGIYACGEVLDVDGITGGFNFQAAWSTANLAAISATHSPFSENL